MGQQLRLSQLIYNAGPGAILETTDGPVVIRDFSTIWNDRPPGQLKPPNHYKVDEPRLEQFLGKGSNQLCRIPSNAELGLPENRYLVKTSSFPKWYICAKAHSGGTSASDASVRQVLFDGGYGAGPKKCQHPGCNGHGSPVRFVGYCNAGHLTDLSWNDALHYTVSKSPAAGKCQNAFLYFEEHGLSMKSVKVTCSVCNKFAKLSDIAHNSKGVQDTVQRINGALTQPDQKLKNALKNFESHSASLQ